MTDVRNMENICALLHELRRSGRYVDFGVLPSSLDGMIKTAEKIHEERKNSR